MVRDLNTGREMSLPTPDLLKTGLDVQRGRALLYFLGGREAEMDRTDIYGISENEPRPIVVAEAPGLKSVPVIDPTGAVLLYTIPAVNPFRQPTAGGRGGEAARAGEVGRPQRQDRPEGLDGQEAQEESSQRRQALRRETSRRGSRLSR